MLANVERSHHVDPLIAEVARAARVTQRTARLVVELFLACVRDEVWSRKKFRIPEFGTFEVRRVRARKVNAPPGQPSGVVRIAGAHVVKFRAAKNWRKK
jgi:nucleoid DNA-binding protein